MVDGGWWMVDGGWWGLLPARCGNGTEKTNATPLCYEVGKNGLKTFYSSLF